MLRHGYGLALPFGEVDGMEWAEALAWQKQQREFFDAVAEANKARPGPGDG